MATTIQISEELQKVLQQKKMFEKESYEEVIWNLVEDTMELSEETKRNIARAEKEISEGKIISFEEIKRKHQLKCIQ